VAVSGVKRPLRNRFGSKTVKKLQRPYLYLTTGITCNGYVTAVAASQRQRFYSGVGAFGL
jgi:hypothetical protein